MGSVFKFFYRAHLYIGLFIALHFLLLAITGSLLLFRHGFAGSEPAPQSYAPAVFDAALQNAIQQFPQGRPLALSIDENQPSLLQIRMNLQGGEKFNGAAKLFFDAKTGAAVAPPQESGFFTALLKIHRELWLGTWGRFYVGIAGLLIAFTFLSGFFIYGKFTRQRPYGEIRKSNATLALMDFHKFLGVTIFAWGLLVSATGCFLAFDSSLIKIYQRGELASLNSTHAGESPLERLPSLAALVESAAKARPKAQLSFLSFPGSEFSLPRHFLFLTREERRSELLVMDGATGAFLEARPLPWYLKATMLSEPLHFGNYGGIPLQAAWLLFATAAGILSMSGPISYWKKKQAALQVSQRKAPGRLPLLPWPMGYKIPFALGILSLGGLIALLRNELPFLALISAILPLFFLALGTHSFLRERRGHA